MMANSLFATITVKSCSSTNSVNTKASPFPIHARKLSQSGQSVLLMESLKTTQAAQLRHKANKEGLAKVDLSLQVRVDASESSSRAMLIQRSLM